MTTGLHGTHVIIGVLFLALCLFRLLRDRFASEHHLGLEFAILYWHLVDLVWFFVFTVYYWWGSQSLSLPPSVGVPGSCLPPPRGEGGTLPP